MEPESLSYTPLNRAKLDEWYAHASRSVKMEITFILIGLITVAVVLLILAALVRKPSHTTPTNKVPSPSLIPAATETPVSSPTPEPTEVPINNASSSGVTIFTDPGGQTIPPAEPQPTYATPMPSSMVMPSVAPM